MILDTDFIIDLMRGRERAKIKLEELLRISDPVGVSAITVMQLFHGVGRSNLPQKEEDKIHRVLHGLIAYPLDFELARKSGKLDGILTKEGTSIGAADSIIATTALAHNEPVITRNVKDFSKVPGLEVISY